MKHIGAFEAKTHFSHILSEVAAGESFIITKHGHNVAVIIPIVKENEQYTQVQRAIQELRTLRKGKKLGPDLSVQALKEKGRK